MKGYMVVDGEEEWRQRLDMKMLFHNQIPGLLKMEIRYIDGDIKFYYNVQGLISLEHFLKQELTEVKDLMGIYRGIIDALRQGQSYFLEPDYYVLKPEEMYWDPRRRTVGLCYYPTAQETVEEESIETHMIHLTEYLMPRVSHRKEDVRGLIYKIYDYVMSTGYSLEGLDELIIDHEKRGLSDGEYIKKDTDTFHREDNIGEYQLIQCNENIGISSKISLLPDQIIKVGRGEECELCIPYCQVSRQHARFVWKLDKIYIEDMGSTNGTQLNHKKISAHKTFLCRHKDIITFADISYRLERNKRDSGCQRTTRETDGSV